MSTRIHPSERNTIVTLPEVLRQMSNIFKRPWTTDNPNHSINTHELQREPGINSPAYQNILLTLVKQNHRESDHDISTAVTGEEMIHYHPTRARRPERERERSKTGKTIHCHRPQKPTPPTQPD